MLLRGTGQRGADGFGDGGRRSGGFGGEVARGAMGEGQADLGPDLGQDFGQALPHAYLWHTRNI